MTEQPRWKILIYACGNAAEHLAAAKDPQAIDIATLLGQPAGAFSQSDALLLVQGHNPAAGRATRLIQEPGQPAARLLETLEGVGDYPASRNAFAAWAMAAYPSQRTLLLLADCQATSQEERYALPGAAFELLDSPDGPDMRPLNQAMLDAILAEAASRGSLSQFLARLLAAITGQKQSSEPAPPSADPRPDQPKERPGMTQERDWTILIYMAGDNGKEFQTKYGNYSLMAEMTSAGYSDIGELQLAGGATDRVAVLVQFDTLDTPPGMEPGSYRLEIRQGAQKWSDHLVEMIPETNMGDPAELAKFIVWGMTRCPAKNTMLVLWNHGLGWKDDDIYQNVRGMSRTVRSGGRARRVNAATFRSTARQITQQAKDPEMDDETRAILCDDSSMDFLTNVEMSQALRIAEVAEDEAEAAAIFADEARLADALTWGNEASKRRLGIIGMDACLMAMLEVNYQVRNFAEVMVASQEVEPMNGWPYTAIVQQLNARPSMTARELATVIVDEYAKSYTTTRSRNVTQSAIDLKQMAMARNLVRDFASAASQAFGEDGALQLAYSKAARATRRTFEDQEYVDLAGFLDKLLENYDRASIIGRKAEALANWIRQPNGPVVHNAATGDFQGKASGISIYVPVDRPSPLYKDLDFSQAGWLDLLQAVYDSV